MTYDRRFRVFQITGEAIVNLFKEGIHPGYQMVRSEHDYRVGGLPQDAQFVRVREDVMRGCLELCIWSSEWEILSEGAIPMTYYLNAQPL